MLFGRRTNEFGRRELFHRQEESSEGIREIDREQLGENSAVIKSRGGGGEGEGRRQNRGHTMVFQKWQGEFGSRDSSAGVKRDKSDNKPLYSIVQDRRDCWNIYPRNRRYLVETYYFSTRLSRKMVYVIVYRVSIVTRDP